MKSLDENIAAALRLARGSRQRKQVLGEEYLGTAGLRGKAKRYGARYDQSARNLLQRLRAAGIPHTVVLGPRGGWYSAKLKILADNEKEQN